ncbi:MAG: BatD family protein [Ignavibacteriaceae bacterium]|jgi:hypothetical protein
MFRRNVVSSILLLIYTAVLYPQTFTAIVQNTTVGLTDQFEVTFSFSGQDINGVKSFTPPNFKGFMVLSGPNQSTSMQIINGAVSGSRSYSYYLQAQNVGKFTIGSAIINYNSKTYSTQPLTITVEKGSPKSSPQQQSSPEISQKEIADNLFILATADKEKVDLGDQVTVTYKLYTRLNIASQMQVAKLPTYEGLWAEEISIPNNITFSTEMYKGKQYRVGVLKKVALFPSRAGELSVTPLELAVPVQIQQKKKSSGSLFDDFFNDPFFNSVQNVNYNAKSNTIKLHVSSLPTQNVPKSFNGAVGDFSLTSQINSLNTKTNEPVTLKINISGSGNIQLLNMPEINLPSGFDKYDPKTSDQINRTGRINGTKTFEYLIVPRDAGKKEIPPIQFSFYNPERKSYVTLYTPSYFIDVQQGPNNGNSNVAGYPKEEIKLLSQDIMYIKTSAGDLARQGDSILFGFGFWTAALLPLVLLSGLITWKRRSDKLAGNLQLLRFQRAKKIARARFKSAKTLLESNDHTGFYAEISQALFGYLEDKLHIPKAEISLDRAVDELQRKNIEDELINNLKVCIEKCEYARFAPGSGGASAMNEMYNDLTKVIIELEKSLSVKKNV